jgi:hypothetical protein
MKIALPLVLATASIGCCSVPPPDPAPPIDQCKAAGREVAALKMCFDDEHCARDVDFYRQVQVALADLEASCQGVLRGQQWRR